MRMLFMLCASEAETVTVILGAPAATASWKPRRFGTRASTVMPGIFTASRTTSRIGHLRQQLRRHERRDLDLLQPAAASARIHCASLGGHGRLMLCKPSRGPTSLRGSA
jgi:hypothetical protein